MPQGSLSGIFRLLAGMALVAWMATGCGAPGGKVNEIDTADKGTIRISVDESFRPVIDSQIKVYMALHPNAQILANYKSEAECLKDLQNDSIRMVIVTRGLSDTEATQMEQRLSYKPLWSKIAYDAVAVIVNKQSPDSMFTQSELQDLLQGKIPGKEVVMDGNTATSTVRFAIDSVLKGKPLGKNVVAAPSSPAVIDYVANNRNAIGMIGVSWVGNQDDNQQLSFLEKVNIGSVQCEACVGQPYTKPFMANMALGRYPLTRGIYFILKEGYHGLGKAFGNFLTYEKGQLIFKSAYLLPAKMSFEVRDIKINEN